MALLEGAPQELLWYFDSAISISLIFLLVPIYVVRPANIIETQVDLGASEYSSSKQTHPIPWDFVDSYFIPQHCLISIYASLLFSMVKLSPFVIRYITNDPTAKISQVTTPNTKGKNTNGRNSIGIKIALGESFPEYITILFLGF